MKHPIRKAPLVGEILGVRDGVRVFVARDPFRNARSEHQAQTGSSIADIFIETVGPGAPEHFVALLGGYAIERGNWHLVRPKPGSTLVFRVQPAGPLVAGIGAIFSALTSAFSAASALYAGLGAIGQAIVGTVASLAVQFVLNALFPARKPQLNKPDTGTAKASYSIAGSRNQAAPWESVPTVFGVHRVTPLFAALPYTEGVGEDQYLRQLYVWGYGPMDVSDIKIGETPLSSFSDVQIEQVPGYGGEAPVTLYPAQVIEEALSVDLKQVDGYQRRTTAAGVTFISVDITLPRGLYWVSSKDGKRRTQDIFVSARYRAVGTTEWLYFPALRLIEATLDVIRRTLAVNVPAGQYEVELAKISPDYDENGEDSYVEEIVWSAVRGMRPGNPITFDKPLCVTAIRIRATSQLNGQLDTLNGICSPRITSFTPGTATFNAITRNPADHFYHLLIGPANARPVSDSRIDLPALYAWHAYCAANGFTFDHVRSERASVHETKLDICAAGRAVPVFKDGKHSVVWDEMDAPIVQMFTPSNSWGFQSEKVFPEPVHALRVRFINREKGYVEDERIVYDDGYSAANATLFEGQEFPGVTDPATIWKLARFHIAQRKLRPETYTLSVDWENLVCTRADRVRVAHDAALIGMQDGRVTAVDLSAQTVTLDKTIFVGADSYRFRFQLADGSFALRDVASAPGTESRTIQLDGAAAMPEPGDLFAFGKRDIETAVFRILSIQSEADLSATMTLVDDAPEISLADKGVIPAFRSNVTAPIDLFASPPVDVRLTDEAYLQGDDFLAAVYLSWKVPRQGRIVGYQVEMNDQASTSTTWRLVATVDAPATRAEIRGLVAGSYGFRVRSIFDDGQFSGWVATPIYSTASLLMAPPDVVDFRVGVIGDVSTLSWSAVVDPGLSHYEIRFINGLDGAVEWNAAVPLLPKVSGISAQVPTMIGTYLIKAVRLTGVKSRTAAVIRTNIAGLLNLNVVEVLDEAPSFAGEMDGVERVGAALQLRSRNTMDQWERLSDVVTLVIGDGDADSRGVELVGYYYFAERIDLQAVYTSRITASIQASGGNTLNTMSQWVRLADVAVLDDTKPEDWSVGLEFRSTLADPDTATEADWSEFQGVVVGDVTARGLEFRLRLDGRPAEVQDVSYSVITPIVTGLSVQIDMPDRVYSQDDVTVPPAGLRVVFDPPFTALKGIAVADQNLMTGDFSQITNKNETGFDIRYFNADGTPVERTMDFLAKGYGSMMP